MEEGVSQNEEEDVKTVTEDVAGRGVSHLIVAARESTSSSEEGVHTVTEDVADRVGSHLVVAARVGTTSSEEGVQTVTEDEADRCGSNLVVTARDGTASSEEGGYMGEVCGLSLGENEAVAASMKGRFVDSLYDPAWKSVSSEEDGHTGDQGLGGNETLTARVRVGVVDSQCVGAGENIATLEDSCMADTLPGLGGNEAQTASMKYGFEDPVSDSAGGITMTAVPVPGSEIDVASVDSSLAASERLTHETSILHTGPSIADGSSLKTSQDFVNSSHDNSETIFENKGLEHSNPECVRISQRITDEASVPADEPVNSDTSSQRIFQDTLNSSCDIAETAYGNNVSGQESVRLYQSMDNEALQCETACCVDGNSQKACRDSLNGNLDVAEAVSGNEGFDLRDSTSTTESEGRELVVGDWPGHEGVGAEQEGSSFHASGCCEMKEDLSSSSGWDSSASSFQSTQIEDVPSVSQPTSIGETVDVSQTSQARKCLDVSSVPQSAQIGQSLNVSLSTEIKESLDVSSVPQSTQFTQIKESLDGSCVPHSTQSKESLVVSSPPESTQNKESLDVSSVSNSTRIRESLDVSFDPQSTQIKEPLDASGVLQFTNILEPSGHVTECHSHNNNNYKQNDFYCGSNSSLLDKSNIKPAYDPQKPEVTVQMDKNKIKPKLESQKQNCTFNCENAHDLPATYKIINNECSISVTGNKPQSFEKSESEMTVKEKEVGATEVPSGMVFPPTTAYEINQAATRSSDPLVSPGNEGSEGSSDAGIQPVSDTSTNDKKGAMEHQPLQNTVQNEPAVVSCGGNEGGNQTGASRQTKVSELCSRFRCKEETSIQLKHFLLMLERNRVLATDRSLAKNPVGESSSCSDPFSSSGKGSILVGGDHPELSADLLRSSTSKNHPELAADDLRSSMPKIHPKMAADSLLQSIPKIHPEVMAGSSLQSSTSKNHPELAVDLLHPTIQNNHPELSAGFSLHTSSSSKTHLELVSGLLQSSTLRNHPELSADFSLHTSTAKSHPEVAADLLHPLTSQNCSSAADNLPASKRSNTQKSSTSSRTKEHSKSKLTKKVSPNHITQADDSPLIKDENSNNCGSDDDDVDDDITDFIPVGMLQVPSGKKLQSFDLETLSAEILANSHQPNLKDGNDFSHRQQASSREGGPNLTEASRLLQEKLKYCLEKQALCNQQRSEHVTSISQTEPGLKTSSQNEARFYSYNSKDQFKEREEYHPSSSQTERDLKTSNQNEPGYYSCSSKEQIQERKEFQLLLRLMEHAQQKQQEQQQQHVQHLQNPLHLTGGRLSRPVNLPKSESLPKSQQKPNYTKVIPHSQLLHSLKPGKDNWKDDRNLRHCHLQQGTSEGTSKPGYLGVVSRAQSLQSLKSDMGDCEDDGNLHLQQVASEGPSKPGYLGTVSHARSSHYLKSNKDAVKDDGNTQHHHQQRASEGPSKSSYYVVASHSNDSQNLAQDKDGNPHHHHHLQQGTSEKPSSGHTGIVSHKIQHNKSEESFGSYSALSGPHAVQQDDVSLGHGHLIKQPRNIQPSRQQIEDQKPPQEVTVSSAGIKHHSGIVSDKSMVPLIAHVPKFVEQPLQKLDPGIHSKTNQPSDQISRFSGTNQQPQSLMEGTCTLRSGQEKSQSESYVSEFPRKPRDLEMPMLRRPGSPRHYSACQEKPESQHSARSACQPGFIGSQNMVRPSQQIFADSVRPVNSMGFANSQRFSNLQVFAKAQGSANSQGPASLQGSANTQGPANPQGSSNLVLMAGSIPLSSSHHQPNTCPVHEQSSVDSSSKDQIFSVHLSTDQRLHELNRIDAAGPPPPSPSSIVPEHHHHHHYPGGQQSQTSSEHKVRASGTPRMSLTDAELPRMGVSVTEPPRMGVSVTETPRMGVSVTEPPRMGVSVTEPPRMGVSVTEPPRIGVSVTVPPRMDVEAVTEPPKMDVSVTEPPIMAVETVTGPPKMGVSATEPPRMGVEAVTGPSRMGLTTEPPRIGVEAVTEPPRIGITATEVVLTAADPTKVNLSPTHTPPKVYLPSLEAKATTEFLKVGLPLADLPGVYPSTATGVSHPLDFKNTNTHPNKPEGTIPSPINPELPVKISRASEFPSTHESSLSEGKGGFMEMTQTEAKGGLVDTSQTEEGEAGLGDKIVKDLNSSDPSFSGNESLQERADEKHKFLACKAQDGISGSCEVDVEVKSDGASLNTVLKNDRGSGLLGLACENSVLNDACSEDTEDRNDHPCIEVASLSEPSAQVREKEDQDAGVVGKVLTKSLTNIEKYNISRKKAVSPAANVEGLQEADEDSSVVGRGGKELEAPSSGVAQRGARQRKLKKAFDEQELLSKSSSRIMTTSQKNATKSSRNKREVYCDQAQMSSQGKGQGPRSSQDKVAEEEEKESLGLRGLKQDMKQVRITVEDIAKKVKGDMKSGEDGTKVTEDISPKHHLLRKTSLKREQQNNAGSSEVAKSATSSKIGCRDASRLVNEVSLTKGTRSGRHSSDVGCTPVRVATRHSISGGSTGKVASSNVKKNARISGENSSIDAGKVASLLDKKMKIASNAGKVTTLLDKKRKIASNAGKVVSLLDKKMKIASNAGKVTSLLDKTKTIAGKIGLQSEDSGRQRSGSLTMVRKMTTRQGLATANKSKSSKVGRMKRSYPSEFMDELPPWRKRAKPTDAPKTVQNSAKGDVKTRADTLRFSEKPKGSSINEIETEPEKLNEMGKRSGKRMMNSSQVALSQPTGEEERKQSLAQMNTCDAGHDMDSGVDKSENIQSEVEDGASHTDKLKTKEQMIGDVDKSENIQSEVGERTCHADKPKTKEQMVCGLDKSGNIQLEVNERTSHADIPEAERKVSGETEKELKDSENVEESKLTMKHNGEDTYKSLSGRSLLEDEKLNTKCSQSLNAGLGIMPTESELQQKLESAGDKPLPKCNVTLFSDSELKVVESIHSSAVCTEMGLGKRFEDMGHSFDNQKMMMFRLVPIPEEDLTDFKELGSLVPVSGFLVPGGAGDRILLPKTFVLGSAESIVSSPPSSWTKPLSSLMLASTPQQMSQAMSSQWVSDDTCAQLTGSKPTKEYDILSRGSSVDTAASIRGLSSKLQNPLISSPQLSSQQPAVWTPDLPHSPSTPPPSAGEYSKKLWIPTIPQSSPSQYRFSPPWNTTPPSVPPSASSSSSSSAWNLSSTSHPSTLMQQQQQQQAWMLPAPHTLEEASWRSTETWDSGHLASTAYCEPDPRQVESMDAGQIYQSNSIQIGDTDCEFNETTPSSQQQQHNHMFTSSEEHSILNSSSDYSSLPMQDTESVDARQDSLIQGFLRHMTSNPGGLSQSELAELSTVTQQDLAYVETRLRQALSSSGLFSSETGYEQDMKGGYEQAPEEDHESCFPSNAGGLVHTVNLDADERHLAGSSDLHLPELGSPSVSAGYFSRSFEGQEMGGGSFCPDVGEVASERLCNLDDSGGRCESADGSEVLQGGSKKKTAARERKSQYEAVIENGVRRLKCLLCGKIFGTSTIYRHLRSHDPNYRVRCEFCDKFYSQKHSLTLHQQKYHPQEAAVAVDGSRRIVKSRESQEDKELNSKISNFAERENSVPEKIDVEPETSNVHERSNFEQIGPSLFEERSSLYQGVEFLEQRRSSLDHKGPVLNLESRVYNREQELQTEGPVFNSEQEPIEIPLGTAEVSAGVQVEAKQREEVGVPDFTAESCSGSKQQKQQDAHRQVEELRRQKAEKKRLTVAKRTAESRKIAKVEMGGGGSYRTEFRGVDEDGRIEKMIECTRNSGFLTEKNIDQSMAAVCSTNQSLASTKAADSDIRQSLAVMNASSPDVTYPLADTSTAGSDTQQPISTDGTPILKSGHYRGELDPNTEALSPGDRSQPEADTEAQGEIRGMHVCQICGIQLCSKNGYMLHIRRHSQEKTKFCSYCQKSFHTTQEVRSHERVHTGEKPYKCEICYSAFAHSGSYVAHKKGHDKRGEMEPFPVINNEIQYPSTFKKPRSSRAEDEEGNKTRKRSKKLKKDISSSSETGVQQRSIEYDSSKLLTPQKEEFNKGFSDGHNFDNRGLEMSGYGSDFGNLSTNVQGLGSNNLRMGDTSQEQSYRNYIGGSNVSSDNCSVDYYGSDLSFNQNISQQLFRMSQMEVSAEEQNFHQYGKYYSENSSVDTDLAMAMPTSVSSVMVNSQQFGSEGSPSRRVENYYSSSRMPPPEYEYNVPSQGAVVPSDQDEYALSLSQYQGDSSSSEIVKKLLQHYNVGSSTYPGSEPLGFGQSAEATSMYSEVGSDVGLAGSYAANRGHQADASLYGPARSNIGQEKQFYKPDAECDTGQQQAAQKPDHPLLPSSDSYWHS